VATWNTSAPQIYDPTANVLPPEDILSVASLRGSGCMVHGPFLSSLLKAILTKVKYPYILSHDTPAARAWPGLYLFCCYFRCDLFYFLDFPLHHWIRRAICLCDFHVAFSDRRLEGDIRSDGICVCRTIRYAILGSRENANVCCVLDRQTKVNWNS
jgi:hypothetical protein